MKGQFIVMTKWLHDYLFQQDENSGYWRITRSKLESMLGLFNEELEYMKREEQPHGKMVTPGRSLSREKDRTERPEDVLWRQDN